MDEITTRASRRIRKPRKRKIRRLATLLVVVKSVERGATKAVHTFHPLTLYITAVLLPIPLGDYKIDKNAFTSSQR